MDYKKLLLNRLLDKYEKSRAYLEEGPARRRIILKLNSSRFPEYDLERTQTREIVNSIVRDLADKGLVGYEWMKFEKGNIIEKIWLSQDKIENAYMEAARVPKKERAEELLSAVRELRKEVKTPWIELYLKIVEKGVKERKSITPFFSDDLKQAEAVLKALREIDKKDGEECLERVFSLRCFGDSKYFERNIKNKLLEIVRKYCLTYEEGLAEMQGPFVVDGLAEAPPEGDILSQVGIVKAPEQLEFCGGLTGRLQGREVDFSIFKHGISINTHTVREMEIKGFADVNRVLFIENKANYVDYIFRKKGGDELVVYHGGFYSPLKGLFFRKIYEASGADRLKFYHWGDIDLGGFQIFHRLKTNIIPSLQPELMDRKALLLREQHGMTFDDRYAAELEKLLQKEDYAEFHDVIEIMLAKRLRLEQEAFLSDG